MTRSLPRLLLAISLLAAFLPAIPATAGPSAAATVADAYESDDTSATARAIVPPAYGQAPLEEPHTFDVTDVGACDQDWVSFGITAAEADAGYVLLLEAMPTTSGVPPVIEVYGPDDVPGDPAAIVGGGDPAASASSMVAPWTATGGASLSFVPEASRTATYRARVRPLNEGGGTGFTAAADTYTLRAKFGLVTRLAGANRYATAARVSAERHPSPSATVDIAVLASGASFADALAGSTLAGALGCPLMLTYPNGVSPETMAELQRLGTDLVYILGGKAALTDRVKAQLQIAGMGVYRVDGATRYETAANVARRADSDSASGTAPIAFLVNGQGFADGVSASAPAAAAAAPVLLTEGARLTPAAASALSDPALGITDVVIVGGTGAVSAATEASVKAIVGSTHVLRVAGSTRYDTSSRLAVWATNQRTGTGSVGTSGTPAAMPALQARRIGIASGGAFPDALAGGVFCGKANAPILLTDPGRVSPYVYAGFDPLDDVDPGEDYFGAMAGISRSYVFGGSAAVSDQVVGDLDLLSWPPF